MCSRQRTCQKKRSTWQTVWNTNFTWKGSSQFPEISQLFWHGICSALEYGQEIARILFWQSLIMRLAWDVNHIVSLWHVITSHFVHEIVSILKRTVTLLRGTIFWGRLSIDSKRSTSFISDFLHASGRMAVYSQQAIMCWAPGHRGVCP